MDKVTWVAADALQPAGYRAHLSGCVAVVHSIGLLFETDWLTQRLFPQSAAAQRAPSTYESACYESAAVLLREAEDAGVATMVYVSAVDPPPFVMTRYRDAKRHAEQALLGSDRVRPVILRPGIIYSWERPYSMPLRAAFAFLQTLGLQPPSEAPLPVTTVARAAVLACTDPTVRGILTVPEMAALAERATS